MRWQSLLTGAVAIAVLGVPRSARADGVPSRVRAYETAYAAAHDGAARIPAWARKYNMNCSGCHYPEPPRLNATGQLFKWAGYRMPDEIGESADADNVSNYLALGTQAVLDYSKVGGQSAEFGFSSPETGAWYAGPLGSHYSAFLELEFGSDGELERIAQFGAMWGKAGSYGGIRAGQMHNFGEWGVAGFDRLPGLESPTAMDGPVTAAVPFVIGEHRLGLEGFYVYGHNRFSAQVLNSLTPEGEGIPGSFGTRKDYLVTDQLLIDNAGSGVQGVAYYGTVTGLDSLAAPTLNSHFWRLGFTASKIYHDFELLGGVIYGKDLDLPASMGYATNSEKGVGYWFSGQYFVKPVSLTVYGRFEFTDPNTATPDDALRRYVGGLVLPITLPQYARWIVEYHLDDPQGNLPRTNDIATALSLNF